MTHSHILQIDKIDDIINSIKNKAGISPVNISHWDSGQDFQKLLMQHLNMPYVENITNYIYGYDLPQTLKSELLCKLNCSANPKTCTLFASATNAISNIIILLKKVRTKSVLILRPVYYTVYESLLYLKDIKSIIKPLTYNSITGEYHIPISELKKFSYDVLWITQPVFSTGVYIPISEIYESCKLYNLVVLDCSLCSISHLQSLMKSLPKNVIIFACPHKLIGINGLKFCFVITPENITDLLENIVDVFTGSLPITVPLSIKHFLSDNYDICYEHTEEYIRNLKKQCICLYNVYNNIVEYNLKSTGIYGLVKLRQYKYTENINFPSLEKMMSEIFVAYLPNNINYGIKENGYSFRVNYTLDENILLPALSRLFTYLNDIHPEL